MRKGMIVLASCLAMATPAVAEGPPPFPDFTFKRVKAPRAGAAPKITVQIDPVEQQRALAVPVAAVRPAAPSTGGAVGGSSSGGGGELDWFWTALPRPAPGMGVVRMEAGLQALKQGGFKAPRLQDLNSIASTHGRDILKATIGTGVSPALVLAVIAVESGGRPDAVSHAGATGLMQLMPATADRFGVSDSTVASDNIRGGVKYLDWLLKEFGGDPILALAGYNAGENAVKANGDVPDYKETRNYVPKVLAAWAVARALCQTPPELVSDGCVFLSG